MSANFLTEGFQYECKQVFNRVHIWVQTFHLWGSNISANIEMFLLTRFVQKSGLEIPSAILKFLMFALIFGPSCVKSCTHIWTDLWRSLHSYMDRPLTKFSLIFGPTCCEVCTHIWTLLWSSLHSYLDRPVMKFALIFGPTCKKVCTHNWTTPIHCTLLTRYRLYRIVFTV